SERDEAGNRLDAAEQCGIDARLRKEHRATLRSVTHRHDRVEAIVETQVGPDSIVLLRTLAPRLRLDSDERRRAWGRVKQTGIATAPIAVAAAERTVER